MRTHHQITLTIWTLIIFCMVWRCLKSYHWAKKTPGVENWNESDEFGSKMEVEKQYPETLHDYHSDYPLAPDIMNVNADMLLDSQKQVYKIYYDGKPKDEKTRINKKNVVHIKTLQY